VYRAHWLTLAVLVLVGSGGYLGFAGPRAALSYAAGLLLAGAACTGGIAAVRWADRITPALTMVVALMTYAMIVVVLAAVLAAADPEIIDVTAFAVGLVVAALVWILAQLRATRPHHGS
jgi:ATP synthase protein I